MKKDIGKIFNLFLLLFNVTFYMVAFVKLLDSVGSAGVCLPTFTAVLMLNAEALSYNQKLFKWFWNGMYAIVIICFLTSLLNFFLLIMSFSTAYKVFLVGNVFLTSILLDRTIYGPVLLRNTKTPFKQKLWNP